MAKKIKKQRIFDDEGERRDWESSGKPVCGDCDWELRSPYSVGWLGNTYTLHYYECKNCGRVRDYIDRPHYDD